MMAIRHNNKHLIKKIHDGNSPQEQTPTHEKFSNVPPQKRQPDQEKFGNVYHKKEQLIKRNAAWSCTQQEQKKKKINVKKKINKKKK